MLMKIKKKIIENTDTLKLLTILRDNDKESFYRVVYRIINECPEKILNNKYKADQKLKALNEMLEHFKEEEEYERCAKIKQLIDGIKEDIILSNNK